MNARKRWAVAAAFLLTIGVVLLAPAVFAPEPSPAKRQFSQIQVGMTMEEVAQLTGHAFVGGMPPDIALQWALDGGIIGVDFAGGRVREKHFTPLEETLFIKLQRWLGVCL